LYDVVIVSRPITFRKTFPILRNHFIPTVPIIYDAEGVWYARDEMFLKSMNRSISSDPEVVKSKRHELNVFHNATAIWFVSEQDAKTVIKDGNFDRKLDYNVITSAFPIFKTKKIQKSPNIGFLGTFHNSTYYNGDAVLYFIDKIFPLVRERISNAVFYICGPEPPIELSSRHDPLNGILVLGVCDLTKFFRNVKVFVAPHKYACGIQDKVTRSLSYGVPVVLGKYAAEALQVKDIVDGVLIADKPEEFSEAVIKILTDSALYDKLHFGSYKLIEDRFSQQSLRQSISNALSKYSKQSCKKDNRCC
jgi:glycosyltransferase involved in cell wall biosynthesis